MNGAHADEPAGGNGPWLGCWIDLGTAYCVPEAGINFKWQIQVRTKAWNFLRIPRR